MLESIKATQSNNHNIEVIFRIDETDDLLNNRDFMLDIYQMIDLRLYIQFIVGPETFPDLGCLWNEMYPKAHGNIFQMGGDDLVYETKDWDEKIVYAFNKYSDEIVLVWGADGIHNQVLATHGFISKKWVDAVGWITPPIGLTYCNDNFVHDIAARLGRHCFLGDVMIRHLWEGGNTERPNYQRMLLNFQKDNDYFYSKAGRDIINEAADKLVAVMGF